jgi:hypothetical protein
MITLLLLLGSITFLRILIGIFGPIEYLEVLHQLYGGEKEKWKKLK